MKLKFVSMKNFLRGFFFLILFFLPAGCGYPHKLTPCPDPPPLPEFQPISYPIRLALVLGGGGAKGIAHIGVLEELEEANIPIDLIVGCSAGSLVGALYADCPDTRCLKALYPLLRANVLMDINVMEARYGLCRGRSMRKFLRKHLSATHFEQLKIPLIIVATDLNSGELIPIGGGPIIPAVEASCSIPFVFAPVEINGRILIDGSVVDPVPVKLARNLGAEVIVAVDLQGLLPRSFPSNLIGVLTRAIEITYLWQSEHRARGSDVLIRPQLGEIGCFDDEYNQIIYRAGRKAGRDAIPLILDKLNAKEADGIKRF